MSAENFVFWLNGFFELSGATTLSEQQVAVIKEHLQLVFTKVTTQTVPVAYPLVSTPKVEPHKPIQVVPYTPPYTPTQTMPSIPNEIKIPGIEVTCNPEAKENETSTTIRQVATGNDCKFLKSYC